jgi:hypothetical protein
MVREADLIIVRAIIVVNSHLLAPGGLIIEQFAIAQATVLSL